MRIIATTCLLALLTTLAYGQKVVSLNSNRILENHYNEQQRALGIPPNALGGTPKAECEEPEDPDVVALIDNTDITVKLTLDTIGLGGDGVYECINCDDLSFGTSYILTDINGSPSDSLIYFAESGLEAVLETVQIRYCNSDNECIEGEVTFLIKRPGRSETLPAIVVQQEELIELTAPLNLPGDLRCSFFIDCEDNYEGRDQLVYLSDYSAPTNTIFYRASRYAGDDKVCFVLCDNNGICDTTNYTLRVNVNSITPPFYDDFSYDSPVPALGLWLDQEVYVNTQIPLYPPSLGAATFDGLTSRGRPYGGGYGEADRLTSTYLDTDAGDWTLSFWLQRGGLGDKPETRDSLLLQFFNSDDEWVTIIKFEGLLANTPFGTLDTFKFYTAPVTSDYQHDRFQFRFVNYSDRSGFRDNWNLDYVRLDDNPTFSPNFSDIAFMAPPDFILENYTSMPWRHFQPQLETELRRTIEVGVFNNFATAQNASPSSASIQELNTGLNPWGAVPTLFNGLESNIAPQVSVLRTYDLQGDPTGFSNVYTNYAAQMGSSDFDGLEELDFQLTYNLANTSQEGLDFVQRNDEVSRTTHFGDYFAYDDGTAELALQTSVNAQLAVAFTASVPDTIYGVQMHFANVNNDFSDQQFRLRIWTEQLDGSPEYSQVFEPFYASTAFDTLQGFTSYRLLDDDGNFTPFAIPAGTFYMGWQQATNCDFAECIAIGYDRNRPQGKQFIFSNDGTGWEPLNENIPEGALMLRPFLSSEIGITSVSSLEEEDQASLQIFPNPSRDRIFLRTSLVNPDQAQVVIYNSTGQQVLRQRFAEAVNISILPAGLYIVQLQDGNGHQSTAQRLIITK